MTRRLRMKDLIRLRDGAVVSLEAAVRSGVVVIRPAWTIWINDTHGNILGYPPRWRKDKTGIFKTEPDDRLRKIYGAGFDFRQVFLADSADGESDWGEVAKSDARLLMNGAAAAA